MTERTETFLNAMTIFGMVLVGLMMVIGVALGVMLAMGKFNPQYDALVGLKFNKTASQEILENGGEIELIVTSSSAEVSDSGAILADDTENTEIVLFVRPTKNSVVTVSNIIDVPSEVVKNQPFKVKAKLASDESNQGGVCYIYAMTKDMKYRVAEPIEIKVDVPVKEITLSAVDTISEEPIDLENKGFIYLDSAKLSVSVSPERSLYVFGDKNTTKEVSYSSTLSTAAFIDKDKLNIEYYKIVGKDEDLNNAKLTPKIVAKIQKYSVEDKTNKKFVETSATINVYPLQLQNILIKNTSYSNADSSFSTKLFSGDPLMISVQDTELKDVVNLDVYLKPTVARKEVGADYNPLSNLMSELKLSVEVTNENDGEVKNGVVVINQISNDDGTYWEIKPTRLLEAGEEARLIIGINNEDNDVSISRAIKVEQVKVEEDSFVYTKKGNDEDGEDDEVDVKAISLTITKKGDDAEVDESNTQINYTFSTVNNPTFNKVVMFATKADDLKEDAPININEVCSPIITADTKTYQVANDMKAQSFIIYPKGSGKVKICSYLVRTNEAGYPIDVNYDIITTDSSQLINAGYVLASGFCMAENINEAIPGQYIVQQEFSALTVTVYEKLTSFDIYTSNEFVDENLVDETNGITMGTGDGNAVTLYLKPNSTLAIPENNRDFSGVGTNYVQVSMAENTMKGALESIFENYLPIEITNYSKYYNNSGEKYSINNAYTRWFEVKLGATTATQDSTSTQKSRTITLSWDNENYSSDIKVTTINVPVSYITINDESSEDYKASTYGLDTDNGYWRWSLDMTGFDSVKYNKTITADDGTESTEVVTYYRWNYTNTNNASLTLPKCKGVADANGNKLIKSPTSCDTKISFFMFDNSIISSSAPITSSDGSSYTSIDALMQALSNSNINSTLKKELWTNIALRMDAKSDSSDYPQASDYVNINNSSSLNIMKAIPSGYSLYMFYSDNQTSFEKAFVNAGFMPIAVKIEYSWPDVTAHIEGSNLSADVFDGDNNVCYIYNVDSQNKRTFTWKSIKTAKMNFGGQEKELDVSYKISLPANNDISTKSDNDTDYTFCLANKEFIDNEELEVKIQRSINYIIMSDVAWNDLKAGMSGEFITDDSKIKTLTESGKTGYDIGTETLTFVIKNITNSSSDGGE